MSTSAATVGTVTGKVTNAAGAPISGASVSSGGNGAITGSDGLYTLQVPAGTSTLTAALAGYQSASESVTVTAGQSTQAATLQIQPLNPGNVTGSVVDGNGQALSGATVSAAGLTTSTAADGSYALSNLPAGQTTINASLTGFQSGSTTVTVVAATTTAAPAITLVSGSGSITGSVKTTAGAAIAGASVGFGGGTATTDANGNYTLTGVPVGTVAGGISQRVPERNPVCHGERRSHQHGKFHSCCGRCHWNRDGKITNASSGAIVTGATVSWSGGSTTSNASGIYTLTNVTAGTQNITAVKTGYLAHTLAVGVTGGATSTLNIPIATGGKISVKVVTSSGAVVSGATITIKGGSISTTVSGSSSSTGFLPPTGFPWARTRSQLRRAASPHRARVRRFPAA